MIIAVNFQFKAIGKKKPEKKSPDFFRVLLSNCLNWKFNAMIILYFEHSF